MKVGLVPVNIGVQSAEQVAGLAQGAEALGYESVWTFEHVIVPIDYASKYPYNDSGKMGAEPETNMVDPLVALAFVAGRTERIRLGTGVNILPQANPLYVAKQAASLDLMSNGRFMLGLGIGWLREEYAALGVPFEKRGARFDDYMAAMRKVWSGEEVDHDSEFLSWHGFKSHPRPVQDPFPVVMGGIKGRIHERIARFGDGWFAPSADPEVLTHHFGEIRRACDAVDRDFGEIEMTCTWIGQGGRDALEGLEAIGVHRVLVPLMALGPDPADGMAKLAEAVIA